MKPRIIAVDKNHLGALIRREIKSSGVKCSLNHIDVSKVTDMGYLFQAMDFNGDISEWNTSNVTDMSGMFAQSKFNGDISNWDTSNVVNMDEMFIESKFNKDISKWNVSNVTCMRYMFYRATCKCDLSDWKPYSLVLSENMFLANRIEKPYWIEIEDLEERKRAIEKHALKSELCEDLSNNGTINKRIKI